MLMTMEISGAGMTFTPQQAAARKYPLQFMCEYANAVLDGDTGELLEYRHLIKRPKYREIWGNAYTKEVGRLASGVKGVVEGTDTIFFIHKHEVPADRMKDVTYDRIYCNVRPEKKDLNRVRMTVGGNRINYPGDCGTPTADLLTVKLLFNSIVSTPNAKFMSIDISNFYLNKVCIRLPGGNGDLAFDHNGFCSVVQQIDKDLLHLGRVCLDEKGGIVIVSDDGDMFEGVLTADVLYDPIQQGV